MFNNWFAGRKPCLVVFANFQGVNTLTMADFKLYQHDGSECGVGEDVHNDPCEPVGASSRAPLPSFTLHS